MRMYKRPVLYLLAGVIALLAVLWGYTVLLQPYRDRQDRAMVAELARDGTLTRVQVRYTGSCTASDPSGTLVELTAVVYDPVTYDSREAVPSAYPQEIQDRLTADLMQQAQTQGLTLKEGGDVSVRRTIEV